MGRYQYWWRLQPQYSLSFLGTHRIVLPLVRVFFFVRYWCVMFVMHWVMSKRKEKKREERSRERGRERETKRRILRLYVRVRKNEKFSTTAYEENRLEVHVYIFAFSSVHRTETKAYHQVTYIFPHLGFLTKEHLLTMKRYVLQPCCTGHAEKSSPFILSFFCPM